MANKKTNSKTNASSYLGRIKFDPKLSLGVIAKYITNIRLVMLLILTIVLIGTTSFINLPRRLNPEVKIPIVNIVTVLPGAGPSDIEKLVTIPIEDKLRSLKDVDTLTSSSQDNVSVITIQFLSKVAADKAKDDVQSLVDSVSDLPTDAHDPSVSALDFEDQPVLTFALTSDKSYPDLMRSAKALTDKLEDLSKVDRVETSGFDDQELEVAIDPAKLNDFGATPFQIQSLLKKSRSSYPAGIVETDNNTFSLSIDSSIETVDDVRNLRLNLGIRQVALSDIASVTVKSKPGHQDAYLATPEHEAKEAVTFYVYKTSAADIQSSGHDINQVVSDFQKSSQGYQITTLVDTSEEISEQFSDLVGEFRSTIILIFITLLLFLGLRQAVIASFTVPLTFLSAFMFMSYTGMTINFLSLFALLLALGLLIDDTIVVVSAMTAYFKSGRFTPKETGLLVWRDTIIPIWSTTITTIWSFVPLLLSTGIIGEFIKPIPIVITVTMISSTGIAVLITLPIMIFLLKPSVPARVYFLLKAILSVVSLVVFVLLLKSNPLFLPIALVALLLSFVFYRAKDKLIQKFKDLVSKLGTKKLRGVLSKIQTVTDKGVIDVEAFAEKYKQTILRILNSKGARKRVIAATLIYAVLSFVLLPLGLVKNEFFPKEDTDQIYLQLELPSGTIRDKVETLGFEVLEDLRHTNEVEFVTMEVGRGFGGSFGGSGSAGTNNVLYSIKLTHAEDRDITSIKISEDLRAKYAGFNKGKISVIEQSGGPPAGSDLQIKILGDDSSKIDAYATKIEEYLSKEPGVVNAQKSIKSGTSKVVFVPDYVAMADYGLTPDFVGFTLRTFASGFTLDSYDINGDGADKQDVVFRMGSGTSQIEDLGQIQITSPTGRSIPLVSLGKFETRINPTVITRESFTRSISVSAGVRPGFSITDENKKLESFADELGLEDGYTWQTGGVNEENAKSVQSILQAMVLSAILILITMVVQFGSFRQAIIVLIVIPLAISSVFLIFALTGTPLSFPALIGVLSLFGIVVTNSMFIVDKINLNIKEGMGFKEAIADAGASRMEPIILTKLSTVLGLLPITIADPVWRGLGGAIISGLLLASTIMLLFIPVLYYSWMKEEK